MSFSVELTKKSGAELIAAERYRQIREEGFDSTHDDEWDNSQLADAAACYALGGVPLGEHQNDLWPWDPKWWKPSPDDRVRELVKAGALIAAEIDRLRRLPTGSPPSFGANDPNTEREK